MRPVTIASNVCLVTLAVCAFIRFKPVEALMIIAAVWLLQPYHPRS